jgi:hypothetical protein
MALQETVLALHILTPADFYSWLPATPEASFKAARLSLGVLLRGIESLSGTWIPWLAVGP